MGTGRRNLKNFKKTQKKVVGKIQSTEGIGDELARLSGIPSALKSKRPKDDPFNQIGL